MHVKYEIKDDKEHFILSSYGMIMGIDLKKKKKHVFERGYVFFGFWSEVNLAKTQLKWNEVSSFELQG